MGLADLSTIPKNTDTSRILKVRILNALRQAAGGGGGGSGTGGASIAGTGSPEGVVSATVPTFYYDTSTGDLWVKETGNGTNTGWVLLIAA